MVEFLSRIAIFRLTYVLLIILVIKLYLDKKKSETELHSLNELKLLELKNNKNADGDKIFYEIKKSLGILNENLGMSNDNLKKYSELAKSFEKLIKTSQSATDNTILLSSNPNGVSIFNLEKSLEPPELYNSIQCRKSRKIYVETTLCVHDLNRDVHVSGSIWREGVWELQIVQPYLEYITKNPDWLVLDIGAQIGQYSLYVAQLGRQVLTVEPFYDNIVRLHKAAKTENITSYITLITNAISNKRGEIKMLQPNGNNIGGQSLVDNKNKVIKKDEIKEDDANKKYYVETILFDDIVPYFPVRQNGKKYEKAIMKIDIEAFEPYAFQHAAHLFDTLDIPIIFMEWGNLPAQQDMKTEIEQMINFLYNRTYKAFGNNIELNRNNWQSGWAWDIIWKKKGY